MTARPPDRIRRMAGWAVLAVALGVLVWSLPGPTVPRAISGLWADHPPLYPSTRFIEEFSLVETVERMEVPALQQYLGGHSSGFARGERTEYRQEFTQTYRLKESDTVRFDEADFLRRLRSEVLKAAAESGVRIARVESADSTFRFDYAADGRVGSFRAVGKREEGEEGEVYSLSCLFLETAGPVETSPAR